MTSAPHSGKDSKRSLNYFMNPKNWWGPLLFILIVSVAGVGMIGYQTYNDAPPMSGFADAEGTVVISQRTIEKGQEVFHRYALMEYGSMFGDGAQRGPDFTAEALHRISISMTDFHVKQHIAEHGQASDLERRMIQEGVKDELKANRYTSENNLVTLTDAQLFALQELKEYYIKLYTEPKTDKSFPPANYISSKEELANLASFFYWGAWVCVAERPGSEFSYTHNWPYDPDAGNTPTAPTIIWSVIGMLAFVLACGVVLYFIGQYNQLSNKFFKAPEKDLLTTDKVNRLQPSPTQRAAFRFFFVAIILFFLQVFSGILTINSFTDYFGRIGIDFSSILPVTVTRSWHLDVAL